jgi:RecA-family ATPase
MKTNENGVYTAAELYNAILPPMLWIAKEFMAEVITLFGGRPKGGKSLLALQLGIAVATGEPFLSTYETVKGAVLYVNVDDPARGRLQTNLRLLGGGVEGLSFMSALPELDNGGLEILDQELARMALTDPCRLLILDTMTALRGEQAGKSLIKADYDFIMSIKRLVSKHGCSVLMVSHTRKDSTYLFTGLKPNRIWPSNKGLDKSPRFV